MAAKDVANLLEIISHDEQLLEVARKAIEDNLVQMRDMHIFVLRNNGLVIKTKDGKDSHIIRMGPESAVGIGLRAIVRHIREHAKEIDSKAFTL